ncbi:hypothetical protein RRF57_004018 [Xylaria bambusicola]|uniref:Uncharacterized protein n=1 Tax=Xylaria bambusicola TaxID=326684 RepID=A0AAN7UFZ1_9PEZI
MTLEKCEEPNERAASRGLEELAHSIVTLSLLTVFLAKFWMAGQRIRCSDRIHDCLSSEPLVFLMQDPGRIVRLSDEDQAA